MRRLVVYMAGEAVGDLEQDDSGLLEFRYRQEWLGRGGATALSRSLPLQSAGFRGKHARAFFAGILPEEEPRRRIASILGVSERNVFALLVRIGGECAGAGLRHHRTSSRPCARRSRHRPPRAAPWPGRRPCCG